MNSMGLRLYLSVQCILKCDLRTTRYILENSIASSNVEIFSFPKLGAGPLKVPLTRLNKQAPSAQPVDGAAKHEVPLPLPTPTHNDRAVPQSASNSTAIESNRERCRMGGAGMHTYRYYPNRKCALAVVQVDGPASAAVVFVGQNLEL